MCEIELASTSEMQEHEAGKLGEQETNELFLELLNNNLLVGLDEHYQAMAQALVDAGVLVSDGGCYELSYVVTTGVIYE